MGAGSSVIPTIDGRISEGEWTDASIIQCALSTWSEVHDCTLYIKNDVSNVYFAAVIRNDDFAGGIVGDSIEIWFENDNDGVRADGDDGLICAPVYGYPCDYYFDSEHGAYMADTMDAGSNDMIAALTHTNSSGIGDYTFEFSHPLDTVDDTHDFSLEIGDTVGFCMIFSDVHPTDPTRGAQLDYYPEIVEDMTHADKYADLVIMPVAHALIVDTIVNPSTLNLRSNGQWITSHIEVPEAFDVNDMNASSILLNNTISVAHPVPATIGDYDNDGEPDLMVKFDRAQVIQYILSSVDMAMLKEKRSMTITLTITGIFNDGTPFKGSDTIRIIYIVQGIGREKLT